MATQIINADPTALRAVTVPNTPAIAEVLPALRVGDVVRFNVRQNPGSGQPGLIFINGQLIPASLPEFLNPGAKVFAKIANVEDKIVFRILQQQQPLSSLPGGPTTQVASDLQSLVKQSGPIGLRGLQAVILPQELKSLFGSNADLSKLLSSLDAKTLTDPAQVLKQLIASSTGDLAATLREAAKLIRQLVDQSTESPTQRFLVALNAELSKLLQSVEDNQASKQTLSLLINILTREVKDPKQAAGTQRELFQSLIANLKNARADLSEVKAHVQQAAAQLLPLTTQTDSAKRKDLHLAGRLEQTAKTLESMASTQETIHKLNPLMHAIGEPALVLMPFIFQGLLSHSEITIDPKGGRKKQQQGKNGSGGEDGEGGDSTEPYQRIQVSVPLPSMGSVDVDIAHRSKEVLVRLSTPDPEKAQFLLDQLEHLASLLRSLGYERAELVANVGTKQENLPAWSLGLHASTSIIA